MKFHLTGVCFSLPDLRIQKNSPFSCYQHGDDICLRCVRHSVAPCDTTGMQNVHFMKNVSSSTDAHDEATEIQLLHCCHNAYWTEETFSTSPLITDTEVSNINPLVTVSPLICVFDLLGMTSSEKFDKISTASPVKLFWVFLNSFFNCLMPRFSIVKLVCWVLKEDCISEQIRCREISHSVPRIDYKRSACSQLSPDKSRKHLTQQTHTRHSYRPQNHC